MVILETAAVGAAGYGIYRGGEESAKKAKQAKKEYQFGQKLRGNRKELSSKNKDRSERIAQINMMRNNRRNDSASSSITNESNTNAWPLGGGTTSTRSTATNNTSDVEDRQKAIMEKLSKNKSKPKSSMFGMFKKKK